MIHYHGTPLTPRDMLYRMAGKHFCVSYANPRDADVAMNIGQSVLWDNGAFSFYTQKKPVDWTGYYEWLEPRLGHPHWAIVPDVIDGTPAENTRLMREWPNRKDCAGAVWHLAEPFGQLQRIVDEGFGKVCFGSSGQYWQIGTDAWCRRVDEAFNCLAQNGPLPWVHMLRGLALAGDRWPFASADSVNVARNFKTDSNGESVCPERMARNIDARQCPIRWHAKAEQLPMFSLEAAL